MKFQTKLTTVAMALAAANGMIPANHQTVSVESPIPMMLTATKVVSCRLVERFDTLFRKDQYLFMKKLLVTAIENAQMFAGTTCRLKTQTSGKNTEKSIAVLIQPTMPKRSASTKMCLSILFNNDHASRGRSFCLLEEDKDD